MIAHVPTLDVGHAVEQHRLAETRRRQVARRAEITIDPDLVAALAWCGANPAALGRPIAEGAYHRAKDLGLLAQDATWRTTTRGQGVLVAVGLIDGKPEPERAAVHVLWAACEQYPRPQFVRAWSDGYAEAYGDSFADELETAEADWDNFDLTAGPWTFWTVVTAMDVPETPTEQPPRPLERNGATTS